MQRQEKPEQGRGNHARQRNMHDKATKQELSRSSIITENPKQLISVQTNEWHHHSDQPPVKQERGDHADGSVVSCRITPENAER
jgi:hypothetical protein